MTKAFPYLRVSSRGQCDGFGFDRQRDHIKEWAVRAGFELGQEYEEMGVSGTKDETNRPAFQSMIEDAMATGIKTVVVESLDRFARDLGVQLQLLAYLKSKGIALVSATTGEDITASMDSDPMRRAMVQMQGIFSELEKNLLVRKLRKARQAKKALTGRCEGNKPYGFYPSESPIRSHILAMAGSGASCRAIAMRLNSEGTPTRRGGPWHDVVVASIIRAAEQTQVAA